MSELTYGYKFENDTHIWHCVGEKGGVHIHAYKSPTNGNWYGGVEVHSKTPLHSFHDKPSQKHCWLIGCPCYHDGSSLWFENHVADELRHCTDFENESLVRYINYCLKEWYESNLENK